MITPRVGAKYELNGSIYAITSITDAVISLCSSDHHKHRFIERNDFDLMQQRGQLRLHERTPSELSQYGQLKSLKPKEQQRVEIRHAIVEDILQRFHGRMPKKAAEEAIKASSEKIGLSRPPSYSTVRTWKSRYLASDCNPIALIRAVAQPPKSCWPAQVDKWIDDYIETEYLKLTRPTLMHVYRLFRGKIASENQERTRLGLPRFEIPSYWTFRRREQRLDRYYVTEKRFGPREAARRYKSGGHLYVDQDLAAASYFDSKELDNVIIHQESKLRGVPILSCQFNPASRFVTGWDISFGAPSAEKMVRATVASILGYGKMACIITDHGPEILNVWALSFFGDLGLLPDYVPVRDADAKAIVERFFLTVKNQFCRMFDGFKHGLANERGEYPSVNLACVTLEQYRLAFSNWLDFYHNNYHTELHMTPVQMRAKLSANALPAERYTEQELSQLCLSTWRLSLDKGRVQKFGLIWCGGGVAEVRQRLRKGQTAIVRFNPCDLGRVWVSHPDTPNDWHEAAGTRPDYQDNLTLSEHQLIRSELRSRGIESFDADAACIMLLELNEMIQKFKKENAEKGLLTTSKSKKKKIESTSKVDPESLLNNQLTNMKPGTKQSSTTDSSDESFSTYQVSPIPPTPKPE